MIFRIAAAAAVFNLTYLFSFALQMIEDFRMSASAAPGVAVRRNNLAGAFLLAVWFFLKTAEAVAVTKGGVPFFVKAVDAALICFIAVRNGEQIDLHPDGVSFRKVLQRPRRFPWESVSAKRTAGGFILRTSDGTIRRIRRTDERFETAGRILETAGVVKD